MTNEKQIDGTTHAEKNSNGNIEHKPDVLTIGDIRSTEETTVNRALVQWFARTDAIIYEQMFNTLDGFSQSTSGSGSVTLSTDRVTLSTGTTSGSHARLRDFDVNDTYRSYTWSKNRTLRAGVDFADAQGPLYVVTGQVTESSKTDGHVGFAMQNGDLIGSVGDGSAQTTTTLLSSAATGKRKLRAEFTAGSKAEFYVDGTKEGEITSGLPSGVTNVSTLFFFVAENSTTTDRSMDINGLEMVQAP